MIILTLRTDSPKSEIGVFNGSQKISYYKWEAHRQLGVTIHTVIKKQLDNEGLKLEDIQGIVVFEGPGSFTGLRIGMSVGNALAYGLSVPLLATGGKNWIKDGLKRLEGGERGRLAVPKYGKNFTVTKPRK